MNWLVFTAVAVGLILLIVMIAICNVILSGKLDKLQTKVDYKRKQRDSIMRMSVISPHSPSGESVPVRSVFSINQTRSEGKPKQSLAQPISSTVSVKAKSESMDFDRHLSDVAVASEILYDDILHDMNMTPGAMEEVDVDAYANLPKESPDPGTDENGDEVIDHIDQDDDIDDIYFGDLTPGGEYAGVPQKDGDSVEDTDGANGPKQK